MSPKTATIEETPQIELAGLTSKQIAGMVTSGEITQEYAESFVSSRAIRKLHKDLEA